MADTLTPEKWGLKESAEWWRAGQAARQQLCGAATEMMLDWPEPEYWTLRLVRENRRSWPLVASAQRDMCLPRMSPQ
ncbi:MAG: hypothetical protein WCH75_01755 [Candidatus Binatia bacterium]